MPRESEGLKITAAWAGPTPANRTPVPSGLRANGWGSAYSTEGGEDLQRLRWNQILCELSAVALEMETEGVAQWHAAVEYEANAVVRHGRRWYQAIRQTTGDQPDTSPSDWRRFFSRTPDP